MIKSNVDTRRCRVVYNYNHIVSYDELIKNGTLFTTFHNGDYLNVLDGLVMKRPSSNKNFMNNRKELIALADIKDDIKIVRNTQGDMIYKRKNPGTPLFKINIVPKYKAKKQIS